MTPMQLRVLAYALIVAERDGFHAITRDLVAQEAGVATGSVNSAWGSIAALRAEVMRHAVANQMLGIIAQGLALGDEIARNADPELKRKALASLS